MNTVISNKTGEALEVVKHVLYSLQVLTVGMFIPFLFVFGITYKTPKATSENGVNISKPHQVISENTTVDYTKFLPDQNG